MCRDKGVWLISEEKQVYTHARVDRQTNMEAAAKTTLRQLRSACLKSPQCLDGEEKTADGYFDEVGAMVTVSTLALQWLAREQAGGLHSDAIKDSVLALLEAAILEGLQEANAPEIECTSAGQSGPYKDTPAADFWEHCLCLVHCSFDGSSDCNQLASLKKSVSSLHQFSLGTSQLLKAFLSVSKNVLSERHFLVLLSRLHDKFWSKEVKKLAERVMPMRTAEALNTSSSETTDSDGVKKLALLMATIRCILSIHGTVANLLGDGYDTREEEEEEGRKGGGAGKGKLDNHRIQIVNQWLCQNCLNPLLVSMATSSPQLLWRLYENAVHLDKENLRKGAETADTHDHLTMVELLTSALHCLASLSEEVNNCPLLKENAPLITSVTMETTLRLVNHCWEQLTQQIKSVPRELPSKVLYLVLGYFVKLHSFLDGYSLDFNDEQREAHAHILHVLSESSEGLREQIISYHTQLCLTSLLQDASSQDWTSTKPFFEGERCSYSIQMWQYHLRGMKHDLCTLLVPHSYDLAESVLLSVLSSTLSHLARRYGAATPSHARLNQFRGDIVSVLSTVLELQPQSNTCEEKHLSLRLSPNLQLIHRSCNQLLGILAVGACPLAELEEVLSQLSPSLQAGRKNGDDRQEKSTESQGYSNLLGDITGGRTSRQWVTFFDQSVSKETTVQAGVVTSLFGHEPKALLTSHVAMDTSLVPCFINDGAGRGGRWTYTQRLSTPPRISVALLQSLLSDGCSLAVKLCSSSCSVASKSLVFDVASLLSHSWPDEWALSRFYKGLCSVRGISFRGQSEGDVDQMKAVDGAILDWLSHRLQIEFESYVLTLSTGLHGNLQDKVKVWHHILSCLNGIGERLSSADIPSSITNLIWSIADDVSERENCSKGVSLAKVVAFVVSRWPTFAHLRLAGPTGDTVSAHCSAVSCSLGGGKPSKGLPATVEDAIASHQTELQAWLNKFDQFLPRPQTSSGSSDVNESTVAECEAMWEVIKTDDVMMTSLAHIHTALMEWSNGLPFSGGNGFNPLGGCSDPPVMEIVDNIDWKGLLRGVIKGGVVTTPRICSLLETVRWEFQDGASGYLEERETQLIKAIRTHLHYSDDCTV